MPAGKTRTPRVVEECPFSFIYEFNTRDGDCLHYVPIGDSTAEHCRTIFSEKHLGMDPKNMGRFVPFTLVVTDDHILGAFVARSSLETRYGAKHPKRMLDSVAGYVDDFCEDLSFKPDTWFPHPNDRILNLRYPAQPWPKHKNFRIDVCRTYQE